MRCTLCPGTGNLFTVQNGIKEWWKCPACEGTGVRAMNGPAQIHVHNPSKGIGKKLKKLAKELGLN